MGGPGHLPPVGHRRADHLERGKANEGGLWGLLGFRGLFGVLGFRAFRVLGFFGDLGNRAFEV